MNTYLIELERHDSIRLRKFLAIHSIEFETNTCYGIVHFDIHCTSNDIETIGDFITKILYEKY